MNYHLYIYCYERNENRVRLRGNEDNEEIMEYRYWVSSHVHVYSENKYYKIYLIS